jgi:hypothetical protein
MTWDLQNLDDETRRRMLTEFENDVLESRVCPSKVVNPSWTVDYLDAHRNAFANGDPSSFAEEIASSGMLQSHQANGNRVNARSASERLAGGQFGAYYARAVAAQAADTGARVQVYRARPSSQSRPSSEAKIGQELDAAELLDDLRRNSTTPGDFAVLPEVGSGLSVRLMS